MFPEIANAARDIFQNTKDKVFFVSAPTGSGKTIGFIKYLDGNVTSTKICFLMPTNAAVGMIKKYCHQPKITLYTPMTFLNELFQHRSMGVVVVDECHIDTEEYQFIIRYLKTFPNLYSKLILLSATCPMVKIKTWFPEVVIHDLCGAIHRFQISYHYLDTDLVQFYNVPVNQQHILRNLFQQYQVKEDKCPRILVFCASASQCQQLAECFDREFENCVAYYGKMESESKEKVTRLFENFKKSFILFCTNALETSVTIKNVNFVFDFGKRFVCRGKVLRMEWCDQSSMIQRAGRTGRTCDGVVVRLMSLSFFNELPEIQDVKYDFDSILLTMYKKKKTKMMKKLFSDDRDIYEQFEERLRRLNIYSYGLNPLKFDYVYRYRNETHMEDAVLLYKLYNRRYKYSPNELFFLYLTIALIISMNINNYPLFYIPKEMRGRKQTFFRNICRVFDKPRHQDELRTYVNIIFNAFIHGTSFVQLYHLNNKFVKDVKRRFLKYWNDAITYCKITDLNTFMTSYLNIAGEEQLSFMYHDEFETIQKFLLYYSHFEIHSVPRLVGYEHAFAIHEAVPFDDIITYSVNRVNIKIRSVHIQHNMYDDHVEERLVLWTNMDVPSVAEYHKKDIMQYVECMNDKRYWKSEFQMTIEEIENEVAYRPGNCKMLETMTEFYSRVQNQSGGESMKRST